MITPIRIAYQVQTGSRTRGGSTGLWQRPCQLVLICSVGKGGGSEAPEETCFTSQENTKVFPQTDLKQLDSSLPYSAAWEVGEGGWQRQGAAHKLGHLSISHKMDGQQGKPAPAHIPTPSAHAPVLPLLLTWKLACSPYFPILGPNGKPTLWLPLLQQKSTILGPWMPTAVLHGGGHVSEPFLCLPWPLAHWHSDQKCTTHTIFPQQNVGHCELNFANDCEVGFFFFQLYYLKKCLMACFMYNSSRSWNLGGNDDLQ